jgi:hypothetical protein
MGGVSRKRNAMADCPHLVIDGMGRCEWCCESVIGSGWTAPKRVDVPPENSQRISDRILKVRWAASYGEPEDLRKALQALNPDELASIPLSSEILTRYLDNRTSMFLASRTRVLCALKAARRTVSNSRLFRRN